MSEELSARVTTFYGGRARGRCYLINDDDGCHVIALTAAEAIAAAMTILQNERRVRRSNPTSADLKMPQPETPPPER